MELAAYFNNTKGTGVLATADSHGNVGAAVYASPHVLADATVAFIRVSKDPVNDSCQPQGKPNHFEKDVASCLVILRSLLT